MIKNQQKWTFSSNTKNATAAPPASQNKNVPTTLKVDQKKNSNQPDISDSTKMIMPLALKAATRVTTTTTTTTTKPPVLPDSSPNIDDLKRHILMLQSLTKNDESFQSKFVVFPHLQRPATDSVVTTIVPSTTSTTLAPSTAQLAIINRISSTTRRTTMPTRKLPIPSNSSKSTTTINKDETHKAEKITIVSHSIYFFLFLVVFLVPIRRRRQLCRCYTLIDMIRMAVENIKLMAGKKN